MLNYFALKKPCRDCPFRTDNGFILRNDRVAGICADLLADKSFACHKTTLHDDDGQHVTTQKEKHCAGAMIMLEHCERPNQMMRIGERLGIYNHAALDMAAPVFKSPAEMKKAYRERNGARG